MKILYTSAELHTAIKATLTSPAVRDRRVVLVAYVGKQAEAFLPNPKGLEIVCALEPGATSAEAIVRLRRRGARVWQSERLHMKVYWSSSKGAVICSANASVGALGRGGLKEAGVWLPRGAVNVRTLLHYAQPRPIRDTDLRSLARASDRLAAGPTRRSSGAQNETPSLREWLESPALKRWKLGWWDKTGVIAKAANAEAVARFGDRAAQVIDCKKSHYHPGDWALLFNADGGRSASWMYVDFVTKVPPSDKRAYSRDYPCQAVQVNTMRHYSWPPFRLDPQARAAIAGAVKEFGEERLEKLATANVPKAFLRFLRKHLPRNAA